MPDKSRTTIIDRTITELPRWELGIALGILTLSTNLRFNYVMQQVKDTVKIIFFIVWTLVGVALLVFMYKSYDMMGSFGPKGLGGNQMMQQNLENAQRGDGPQGMMQNSLDQEGAGQNGPANQTQQPAEQPQN